jgi:ribosome-associated translation inhibitor RaiA
MGITFQQKNVPKKEFTAFVDYFNEKRKSIEALLTKFSHDSVILKSTIEKFEKHDAYEVELCLVLPTKTIVAKEASHQITKAIDLSKDRLLSQIKKHMAHLRKDRSHQSIRKEHVEVKEAIEVFE